MKRSLRSTNANERTGSQVKRRSGHWFLDVEATASRCPRHMDTSKCMVSRAHWQVLIIR